MASNYVEENMDTVINLKRGRTESDPPEKAESTKQRKENEGGLKHKQGCNGNENNSETNESDSEEVSTNKILKEIRAMSLKLEGTATQASVNYAFNNLDADIKAAKNLAEENAKEIEKIKSAQKATTTEGFEMKTKYSLLRQETYSRKINLIFEGIEEGGRQENDVTLIQVLQNVLNKEMGIYKVEIDVAHRLGSLVPNRRKPRPVIVKFLKLSDRRRVWSGKLKLKPTNKQGTERIWIREDIPKEAKEINDTLYKTLNAANRIGSYGQCNVRNFHLYFNGLAYTVDELEELPHEIRPSTLATQTDDVTLVFFTKKSPFSNHYPRQFKVEGILYACIEQYMARERAIFAKEQPSTILKIMQETDPVQLKIILYHLRKDNRQKEWEEVAADKIKPAIYAKFTQHEDLRQHLLKTGDKTLGETSPTDLFWGIGLALYDKNALDKTRWRGKNAQGLLLMAVRALLKRP